MSELAAIEDRALAELNAAADEAALRAWNTKYFGKQGEVLLAVKKVGSSRSGSRAVLAVRNASDGSALKRHRILLPGCDSTASRRVSAPPRGAGP